MQIISLNSNHNIISRPQCILVTVTVPYLNIYEQFMHNNYQHTYPFFEMHFTEWIEIGLDLKNSTLL